MQVASSYSLQPTLQDRPQWRDFQTLARFNSEEAFFEKVSTEDLLNKNFIKQKFITAAQEHFQWNEKELDAIFAYDPNWKQGIITPLHVRKLDEKSLISVLRPLETSSDSIRAFNFKIKNDNQQEITANQFLVFLTSLNLKQEEKVELEYNPTDRSYNIFVKKQTFFESLLGYCQGGTPSRVKTNLLLNTILQKSSFQDNDEVQELFISYLLPSKERGKELNSLLEKLTNSSEEKVEKFFHLPKSELFNSSEIINLKPRIRSHSFLLSLFSQEKNFLGKGGIGEVYSLRGREKGDFVFKQLQEQFVSPRKFQEEIEAKVYISQPKESVSSLLSQGERTAKTDYLQEHLARTTHFILKIKRIPTSDILLVPVDNTSEDLFLVPVDKIKFFLHNLDSHTQITSLGEIQEKASGSNIWTQLSYLSIEDRAAISQQLFNIVLKLEEESLVHQDIKLENLIYDSETKKLTLIDWDFATKGISNNSSGTKRYQPMYVKAGFPYSTESNAYSSFITLLEVNTSGRNSQLLPAKITSLYDSLYLNERDKEGRALAQSENLQAIIKHLDGLKCDDKTKIILLKLLLASLINQPEKNNVASEIRMGILTRVTPVSLQGSSLQTLLPILLPNLTS